MSQGDQFVLKAPGAWQCTWQCTWQCIHRPIWECMHCFYLFSVSLCSSFLFPLVLWSGIGPEAATCAGLCGSFISRSMSPALEFSCCRHGHFVNIEPTALHKSCLVYLRAVTAWNVGIRVYVLPWPVCSDQIPPAGTYVTVELHGHACGLVYLHTSADRVAAFWFLLFCWQGGSVCIRLIWFRV